jgi:phospholipid/cholesterol/gamma-HCH transport system ATP-binding protein
MSTSPTLPDGEEALIRIRGLRNAFGEEGEQVIHDNLDLDVKRG